MKLKINPSARTKKRYLLIEAESKEEIEKAILEYIGVLGWAKAEPFFVGKKGKNTILAVNREELERVKAAFEVCSKTIKIISISGTLKGLDRNL